MKKLQSIFRRLPARYVIIALIVAVAVSCITVSGTFASFQTTVIGVGETPVSKWDFKVKINGNTTVDDNGNDASLVENVKLAGDESHPNNRDVTVIDEVFEKYLLAPGTAGYMPVEVDGSACETSLLITVKAYFGDLPTDGSFTFTDNLGNALGVTTATGFTPTKAPSFTVTKYSVIEYNYYLNYKEAQEWKTANAGYIDIGFRWKWADNGSTQNYDATKFFTEIRVTGQQVTNANQVSGIKAINFVKTASDFKVGNVLNIASADITDAEVNVDTATQIGSSRDFYLDVLPATASPFAGKVKNSFTVKSTGTDNIVLGTTRMEVEYPTTNVPRAIVDAPSATSVTISNDFQVDLVDILNVGLGNNVPNTMTDALYDVLANAQAMNNVKTYFNDNTAVGNVNELLTIIKANYKDSGATMIAWDGSTGKFAYVKDATTAKYKYFVAYDEIPASQDYSIFFTGAALPQDIDLNVGLDVFAATTPANNTIRYERTGEVDAQSIIIRTDSLNTALTINAPTDTIKHYGIAGSTNIIAAANESYHEYGTVPYVEIAQGRLALEAGAAVTNVHIAANKDATSFNDVIVAKASSVAKPTFSRDTVSIGADDVLVLEIQSDTNNDANTNSDFVWLTKQGIYEQTMVSDNKEGTDKVYVDTSDRSTETKTTAIEISNEYKGAKDASGNILDVVSGKGVNQITVTFNPTTREFEATIAQGATLEGDDLTTALAKAVESVTEEVEESGLTTEEKKEQKENAVDEKLYPDAVAIIVTPDGTNDYDSLTAAMKAATKGQTIKLMKDTTITSITSDSFKTDEVTLNLNGHKVSVSAEWLMTDTVNVKYTNSPIDVTVKNGTIEYTSDGYIRFENASTGTFTGVTFKSSDGKYNKALKVYATNITGANDVNTYSFTDCVFENVYVAFEGCSDSCNNCVISFKNCDFSATTTENNANMIIVGDYNYGQLTIDGCNFDINSTALGGCGYCFKIDTYIPHTDGQKVDVLVKDSVFNSQNNARPYCFKTITYNQVPGVTNVDNCTITNTELYYQGVPYSYFRDYSKSGSGSAGPYIWIESSRLEKNDASKAEYDLFANSVDYSKSKYYVVVNGDDYFYCNNGYYTLSKGKFEDGVYKYSINSNVWYYEVGNDDLSDTLEGNNANIKIYELTRVYQVKYKFGNASPIVVGYYKVGDSVSYTDTSIDVSKQYYVSNFATRDGQTVSISSMTTGDKTIECYEIYTITGKLGENTIFSANWKITNSTKKWIITPNNSMRSYYYDVESLTIGGVMLDPSKYTVTKENTQYYLYVELESEDLITGNVVINFSLNKLGVAYTELVQNGSYEANSQYLLKDGAYSYLVGLSTASNIFEGTYLTINDTTLTFSKSGWSTKNYTIDNTALMTATNGIEVYALTIKN